MKLEMPRVHSRTAFHRVDTTTTQKIPPIPENVWQQRTEKSSNHQNLDKTFSGSAFKRNRTTQEIQKEKLTEVAREYSSSK